MTAPIAERLADEVDLAVGTVLFRAHERARDTRKLQKAIAVALVDMALVAAETPA